MASIINTYDANSTLVYPRTSTDALDFNDGVKQGAEAIAAALSKNHEDLVIGNIEIVADHELKSPKVIADQVFTKSITDEGNLVVGGYTNMNGLNVLDGSVSVKNGGIDVLGDIDVSVGHVKADKANFKDCSFGPIHIDGNDNKIYVNGNTTLVNDPYSYTLHQLATQTGVGRHRFYDTTQLYVTGAVTYTGISSRTYTDPSVYIKNGNLYTKGLYVGGNLEANKIDPTNIVLKGKSTNLISYDSEFNFIPTGYDDDVYINYRTENSGRGKISKYVFYDGSQGYTELDAAVYRCRGGSTCLKADPSANGELTIGSQNTNIKTYIQGNSVSVQSSTGTSTFSRDSIVLDTTKRYIKSTGTKLLTDTTLTGKYTEIYSDADNISLSAKFRSSNSKLELTASKIYMDSPLVEIDSDASVGGDVSVYGILNVNGGNTIKSTGSYLLGDVSYGGNSKRYDRPNDLYRGSSIPMHGLMIYTMDKCDYAAGSSGQVLNYANDLPIGYAPCGVVVSGRTYAECDTYLSNYHKNCIIPFLKKMLPGYDTSDFTYTPSITYDSTLHVNIRYRGKFTNIVTIGREGNKTSIDIPDLPPYKTAANEGGAQITMVYMVRIW